MLKKLLIAAVMVFFGFGMIAQADEGGWKEWATSLGDYNPVIREIVKKFRDNINEANESMKEARKKNNGVAREKVIARYSGRAESIIAELKALKPPRDLESPHGTLIKTLGYRKISDEAALRDDPENAILYQLKAVRSDLNYFEELRSIYAAHGAPAKYTDRMDTVIAKFRRSVDDYKELVNK